MRGLRIILALSLAALVIAGTVPRSVIYPVGRPLSLVEIVRDTLGVPHVFASNRSDLFFGQGYAAAGDRIFQMDWSRRRLLGRQAEILGKSRIVEDFRIRALTLERVARDLHGRLDPAEREALEAYASGVNEWLRTNPLPVEFEKLDYRPDPWRSIDALVLWRGMALTLTDLTDDLDDAAELKAPTDRRTGRHSLFLTHVSDPAREDRLGSNGWAVGGPRSRSGYPILAGDPHLGYAMPGALMRMALADTGAAITGFALPGVPGIAIGRTRHVAFTPTAFQGDAADVFRFPLLAAGGDRYRTAKGISPITRIRPLVWMKVNRWFSLPVFWQPIEMTPFGPVVRRDDEWIDVLRWAGREVIPGEGLITVPMIEVESRADVERVLGKLGLPDLNIIVADETGDIARFIGGRLPRRTPHRGPRDGLDETLAWQGFWTPEAMPRRVNPPENLVISANGSPPEDYPPAVSTRLDRAPASWLGRDWPRARQARLEALLGERTGLSVDDCTAMQRDTFVPDGKTEAGVLVAGANPADLSPAASEALEILKRWDGFADADSAAPSLFRAWQAFGAGNAGLEKGVRFLSEHLGGAPGDWRWGRIHQAVLRHPMEDLDSTWTTGPFPRSGDRGTVDVAGYGRFDTGRNPSALSLHGPAMRMVCDLSPGGPTRGVLLAGQSGDPGSRHYRDQFDLWRAGGTVLFTPPGERPGPADSVKQLRP